ncbi:MAG: AAA family ATPase [Bacteroidia bacterium]|nr:AAA family ATPase [Bacteroidia bacterium]
MFNFNNMKKIGIDIIGREKEIHELRVILEQSSVVMSSTRRMGKTMILTKMDEIQHPGTKTMLCYVESVQSAEEFVNVFRENLISQRLLKESDLKRVFKWLNENFGNKDIGFFKTPDFKRHWKTILNLMMDDLVEKHDVQVILMLDEFPKMLWNLIQNGNHQQAEEILDELRNIRERHEKRSKLRFIYCGSIGMNLVIKYLVKQFNYAGAPLNSMRHYIVKEMIPNDAILLIRHLMVKNNLDLEDGLVSYMATACSCLPFFIDRVITQIKLSFNEVPITQTRIDEIVDKFISGRENNNKRIAHELLRILCKSNDPLISETLVNLVKSKIEAEDYQISEIITDLFEDMYVDRIVEGESNSYQFRFILLKKWWRLNFA